jgi:hypothetical protein
MAGAIAAWAKAADGFAEETRGTLLAPGAHLGMPRRSSLAFAAAINGSERPDRWIQAKPRGRSVKDIAPPDSSIRTHP